VVDRRADFQALRDRRDGRQHHRRIFVVGLAAPCAVEPVRFGQPREFGNRVHRQLRTGVELDIDLHPVSDNIKNPVDQGAKQTAGNKLLDVPSRFRVRIAQFLISGLGTRLCRKLLGLNPALPEIPKRSAHDLLRELTGIDLSRCPRCQKGTMIVVAELPALPYSPQWDSS
jgi:hypothetical protein